MGTRRLGDRLVLGPQRRQRWMMRRLRELDREDAGHPQRRRPPGQVRRTVATVIGVCVVAAGALALLNVEYGVTLTRDGFEGREPLGRPPRTTEGVGTFAFVDHQRGAPQDPVAYDPCRKIEYALNGRLGPVGGDRVIEQAVDEISRATGLVFDRVADTDRLPVLEANPFGTLREPVVVGWTSPAVVPELAGDVAGLGGSTSYMRAPREGTQYVTGIVALDTPQLLEVWSRPQGRAQVRAIVLHELGHLVGLAHVDDPGELMFDGNVGRLSFGPGDREGLAALGSGDCFP